MKNLNQKALLFLIVILIALCSFFIFQWNSEKEQSKVLLSVKENMIFRNFTYLTKEMSNVAEALDYYDQDFIEQEKELFLKALDISELTLDETDENLYFLLNSDNSAVQENMNVLYEHKLWNIQEVLREIRNGNISSENEIHLIGAVIKKHNDKLSDMFYGDQQIGLEGLNTKEGLMDVIEIIDLMNEEIGEVINE